MRLLCCCWCCFCNCWHFPIVLALLAGLTQWLAADAYNEDAFNLKNILKECRICLHPRLLCDLWHKGFLLEVCGKLLVAEEDARRRLIGMEMFILHLLLSLTTSAMQATPSA